MTIDADVAKVAKQFGIDPALIQAVVNAEGNILKASQADCLFGGLSFSDTVVGRERPHASQLGGVTKNHAPAINRHPDIRASVAGLLSACCPSAIGNGIRAVYVNTIERVAGRAWPHVAQEQREVIRPLVCHRNTAPSVVGVLLRSRIRAAAFRVLPRTILTGFTQAVSGALLRSALPSKAAATPTAPARERRARHYSRFSASAEASPMGFRFVVQRTAKDSQTAEYFTPKFGVPHMEDVTPNGLVLL